MSLPLNPSYQQACELVDSESLDLWQSVVENICQQHQLSCNHIVKINGWANALFNVDDAFIVKLVPPNWHNQGISELASLKLLQAHTLPVATPKLIAHGELNGWAYLVMSKLTGVTLHDIWPNLSEGNQCVIVTQVAEFALALHQLPMPNDNEIKLDWAKFLHQQKTNCFAKHQKVQLHPKLLHSMVAFLDKVDYQAKSIEPCLIHTDLHAGNLLVTQLNEPSGKQWQLSGVIDFGDAFIAPERYFEYATTSALLGLGNKSVNQALLDAYQFDIKDKKAFQQHLMALSMLRHNGSIEYLFKRVPGSETLTDWDEVAELFFAL